MLEKIKTLDYISVKETDNLEKISLLYVNEDNNVYTKTVSAGTFKIDDLENIPELIEKIFINKIKDIKRNSTNININIDEIANYINDNFKILKESTIKIGYDDKFIIIPKKIHITKNNNDLIDIINEKNINIPIIISEYLNDEIIFGYKTNIDQPGIIVATNENALNDKNNIKIALIDIGMFPEKAYYIIKIIKKHEN